MERKINYIIFTLIVPLMIFASTPSQQVYMAYINGDMGQWKKILSQSQQNNRPTPLQRLERVNYQYGYIAWCIGNKKMSEAREWISRMDADLDNLEKAGYALSSVYAYKAALYGYRIGINKLQAPFLGPKSSSYAEKAIQTDPSNALGHQQYGNIRYYTPTLFGGSKEDAASSLLKAIQLMETHPEQLKWDWNYLSLLTAVAEMYYETGDRTKALIYLQKALKKEPGYQWVKNELLPQYQKNK